MANAFIHASQSRFARAIIQINGFSVPFLMVEVVKSSLYEAGTFEVSLSIKALPTTVNEDFWASNKAFLVDIYVGFPADGANYTINGLTKFFVGQVDEINFDDIGGTVLLTGRDLTAKFIENKTTEKYQNLTSSEVVKKLADQVGLKSVITPTTTLVGYYYNIDHVQLASEQSLWNIITYLAQKEDFLAYVDGQTFYFVPKPDQSAKDAFVIRYVKPTASSGSPSLNGLSLRAEKSMTIARDVIVTIKSWNQKQYKGFKVSVRQTPTKATVLSQKAQPIGDSQRYVFIIGGLTKEQAIQEAYKKARDISQHQRVIEFSAPAVVNFERNSIIQLTGYRDEFNQFYYPSRATYRLSVNEFTMTIDAKNSSPNTQVIL